jgi:hypothetical protein
MISPYVSVRAAFANATNSQLQARLRGELGRAGLYALEVAQKQAFSFSPGGLIGRAQDRAWMHRHPAFAAVG